MSSLNFPNIELFRNHLFAYWNDLLLNRSLSTNDILEYAKDLDGNTQANCLRCCLRRGNIEEGDYITLNRYVEGNITYVRTTYERVTWSGEHTFYIENETMASYILQEYRSKLFITNNPLTIELEYDNTDFEDLNNNLNNIKKPCFNPKKINGKNQNHKVSTNHKT